jgi:aspartate racemase
MIEKENKTIGILGGMGPEATAFMFELFIRKTKAEKDQDHPKIIIYSNPETPPRTDAIFEAGEDPVPYLIEGISALKKAGADMIVMPCVTAHYFIPKVKNELEFKFISLINEAVKWTEKNIPNVQKVGLISSAGTIKSEIFHQAFNKKGIKLTTPDKSEQKKVMEALFGCKGVKAGYKTGTSRNCILRTASSLINRGAEAIIAGCTEIPLVLKKDDIKVPYIEPMQIAVTAALKQAGYKTKE